MAHVVLDTDVASQLVKDKLPPAFAAQLAPYDAAPSFATVGELVRWRSERDLGAVRRAKLDLFLATVPMIDGLRDVAHKWGEIVGFARRRGRPRPSNDSWVAACCLTYDLPLATLNVKDFEDYVEYEGLQLITA